MPVRSRDTATRDWNGFVRVSVAPTGRDGGPRRPVPRRRRPAEHDPISPRRVLLGDSKAGRRVAAKGYGAVRDIDLNTAHCSSVSEASTGARYEEEARRRRRGLWKTLRERCRSVRVVAVVRTSPARLERIVDLKELERALSHVTPGPLPPCAVG